MPFPAEFDAIRVVLVSTRNPLNIGAAARALCNFGFRSLRIVHPFEASFREARSAVGAAPVLANAEEYPSVGDAIADCTLVVGTTPDARRQPQHPQKFLKEGAEAIHQHLQTDSSNRRVAILFGSEKTGLTREHLSHCDWLLHIPTAEEQPSMNLGQAVAVCLYELSRDLRPLPTKSSPQENIASAGDRERMTEVLLETLQKSDYFSAPDSPERRVEVRRLIYRLHLTSQDARIWMGMLRQTLWKVCQSDENPE